MTERIVVIDDTEATRYIVSKWLSSAGFEVSQASTGTEGLALIAQRRPVLVVLDVNLPDMDGFEVCRRIKAECVSPVMVLHLTASRMEPADRVSGLEGGADGYLIEPVQREELIAVVHSLLRLANAEAAARVSESHLKAVISNSPDTISILYADGRLTHLNETRSLMNVPAPGNVASALENVVEEDRSKIVTLVQDVVSRPNARVTARYRVHHTDGTVHHFESTGHNALHDPDIGGMVVTTRDVTTAARAASLLEVESRLLRMIASGTDLSEILNAIIGEVKSRLPHARCAIQMLDDAKTLSVAAAVDDRALACSAMAGEPLDDRHSICAAALNNGRELVVERPWKSKRWGTAACFAANRGISTCWATPIKDVKGQPLGVLSCYFLRPGEPDAEAQLTVQSAASLAAIAIDRHKAEARLLHQSLHDDLTGLANRALALEHIRAFQAHAVESGATGAVLFIDLDGLRLINETRGRDRGDEVLTSTAERLTRSVRSGDQVARVGDDEFTVTCPAVRDESEAVQLAERLLGVLSASLPAADGEIRVSASIGIAITRGANPHPEALLRNAETAMQRAKRGGGNWWQMFDQRLRRRALQRQRTAACVRQAIDDRAFSVWYQPVVSLTQRQAVSIEALVRWRRGSSFVPPAEFIPVVEELGLISQLGDFVAQRACADLARLDERFRDGQLRISINAAAQQLTDGTIAPAIERVLRRTGIDARRVDIEVTEGALISDRAAARRSIHGLRDLGVGISLDDFGTGYSSLSFLKEFPKVRVVKIDRSFMGARGSQVLLTCQSSRQRWRLRALTTVESSRRGSRTWSSCAPYTPPASISFKGTCWPGRCRSTTSAAR